MELMELDGSQGGGQLLRTALSLSLCTGTPFSLSNIRAKRPRPGLMRQHLTAVQAATLIGNAKVSGAELGAESLRFEPGTVQAGDYHFNTGSAGSTTLVLQTVLPALWRCDRSSRVRLEGGTHNPMAPCADFLDETYFAVLRRLGIEANVTLERHGFYPAGGGSLKVEVLPSQASGDVTLDTRGELDRIEGVALLSALASSIGQRELAVLSKRLGIADDHLQLRSVKPPMGPGNTLLVKLRHRHHTEVFSSHGQRGVTAEAVAERVARQAKAYLDSSAFAGEHLADQLLLPMALAGGGTFTTHVISDHVRSHARLIEKFLPVEIDWREEAPGLWRVCVAP